METSLLLGTALGFIFGVIASTIWYHHKFYPLIAYFEASMEYNKTKEKFE
jgi:hypothetical protein